MVAKRCVMSELTPCNWCSLERIKTHAKQDGLIVTIIKASPWVENPDFAPNAVNVYVHPKTVTKKEIETIEKVPESAVAKKKYWMTWFMELTDHCVC